MFRPRFRLSLLFIVAALVAGVSMWLHQAVVRDRNIRELCSEKWVLSVIDKHDNNHAVRLNTKVLNFFSKQFVYSDNIHNLVILTDRIDARDSFQKYDGLDLGGTLITLMFTPESESERDLVALSQINFWLKQFRKVETLGIAKESIIADFFESSNDTAIIQELIVRDSVFDTTTLKKMFEMSKAAPKNFVLIKNIIRGIANDLRESGISENDFELFENKNQFVDEASAKLP